MDPHLKRELINLTFHELQDSKLSLEYIIKLYRTIYNRTGAFAESISDFNQLSTSDKSVLLSYNLESVCIVRIASNLHTKLSYKHDFEELKLFQGPCSLKIEQIFNIPWAVDQDHVNLYCKTVNDIINLPEFDEKINVLFQMIVLLNTSGCHPMDDVSKVDKMKKTFVSLLLKYLQSLLGYPKAFTALPKYMGFLPILRILSDKTQRRLQTTVEAPRH